MTAIDELTRKAPQTGRLTWIGLRPGRGEPLRSVAEVEALDHLGLAGDHRIDGRSPDPEAKRQVTLIQAEHLDVVAAILGRPVTPELTRRNLVVSGFSVNALRDQRFAIGDVVLEGSGPCHPCSRMEANLGPGGYAAMRGHGGITARIVAGSVLQVGDPVRLLATAEHVN